MLAANHGSAVSSTRANCIMQRLSAYSNCTHRSVSAMSLGLSFYPARALQHPHRCSCHGRQGTQAAPGRNLVKKAAFITPRSQDSFVAPWRRQAADVVERARKQDVNQAFAVAGTLTDMPFAAATALQVAGFPGTLHLPMRPDEAKALMALGKPAPFGLHTETVLDPAVRKALQIETTHVTASEVWQKQLKKVTTAVARQLGVDPKTTVEARPYKLLMYTEGGHFKAHKDTEKEPGMFGTLVVQLPVDGGHHGGDLVFKHQGKTKRWLTETNSSSTFQYAAFYADVEHVLLPITSGTRVVMVYNLVRTGDGAMPTKIQGGPLIQELRSAVASWEQDLLADEHGTPDYLCVCLDHQYTESGLSFSALKGQDAKVVGCLSHPGAGLDVHLALLKRTSKDSRTVPYGECNEVYEVDEFISTAGTWPGSEIIDYLGLSHGGQECDTDMPKPQLLGGGVVPAWDIELDSEDHRYKYRMVGIDDEDDKSHRDRHVEWDTVPYTGNDGGTTDTIYHNTVAIIWPKACASSVLGGTLESETYLLKLRQAQEDIAGVEATLQRIVRVFQDKYLTLRWPELKTEEQHIADALHSLGNLEPSIAVPGLASVIRHLPPQAVFYWGPRKAMMDSFVKHGSPDGVLSVLIDLIRTRGRDAVGGFALLAIEAADKSVQLGSTLADALLPQTLLADDAQQLLSSMHPDSVTHLFRLICKLPAQQRHVDQFVTTVLALADPQPILDSLLKHMRKADMRDAVSQVPGQLKVLAQSRQKHLQKLLDSKAFQFSWEMKKASVPGYPEVEAFLHGSVQQATFEYESHTKAMQLVEGYFYNTETCSLVLERNPRSQSIQDNFKYVLKEAYTAKATVTQFGETYAVTITKTTALHDCLRSLHAHECSHIRDALQSAEQMLQLCDESLTAVKQQRGRRRGKNTAGASS